MARKPKPDFIPVTFAYKLRNGADTEVMRSVSTAITDLLERRGVPFPESADITPSSVTPDRWAGLKYKVIFPRSMIISRNHHDDVVVEMHEAIQQALTAHKIRLYTWSAASHDTGYGFHRRCW